MSEVKRGYPNPNYTEEDILTGKVTEETLLELAPYMVMIDADRYEKLISKAAALDILTAQIRTTGEINETVVRAITGTLEAKELVPKSEADSYFNWYVEKRKVCEEQSKRIASLEHARDELIELLRQNGIGTSMDELLGKSKEEA